MSTPFVPRSERYWSDLPRWLRALGCFGWERGVLRFKWGEIAYRRLGLGLKYSVYHDEAHVMVQLGWPTFHIKAPMVIRQRPGTEDWNASYGFSTFEDAIHLNWRLWLKLIYLPWSYGSAIRHSVFDPSGRKRPYVAEYGNETGVFKDGRCVEKHPYVYVLRSGEIQHRTATIYGDEMEWRLRYFPWLPWPRKIRRSISIDFDAEVGERTGSRKGGVTGCSFEWRDGESMKSCLQRMQHEREFR